MHGAVERGESLRRAPVIELPPKYMSITERLYYLRERGYGIKTAGCIELGKLGKLLSEERISRPQFLRDMREIALTMEAMDIQKKEEKRDNAVER